MKKSATLHYTKQHSLTPLQGIHTEWDLVSQYYTDERDPAIRADVDYAVKKYTSFAKRWRNTAFTSNPRVLAKALHEYEQLNDPRITKPKRYFHLRLEKNSQDAQAEKQLALLRRELREASDRIIFFSIELGKIDKTTKKQLLKAPELQPYSYYLQNIFRSSQYDLTEAEEKIIRLKATAATTLWQQLTEKLLSTETITWKKKTLTLAEGLESVESTAAVDKAKLWDTLITRIDTLGTVAEHEFNAIIADEHQESALRGYKKPYSATALAYEHSEDSIESLVAGVSNRGFALSRKFYKLKAAYHGVEKLHYVQKYDAIGTPPAIPFKDAVEICRDVFHSVNPEYRALFDHMLTTGGIDVYPKAGKSGGAFMSSSTGHPINVLLNHTDTVRSLETLAHEMGHAIHADRATRAQRPFYDGFSTATAETASTLFENLVFDALYESVPKESKLALLHKKITSDIASIQRQIAFFNCELEIHTTIAREGAMTHQELKDCMARHLRSYLGASVDVRPIDGASYVFIPHLRYGFYVYTYAFGQLASRLMADEFKHDRSYAKKIEIFLSAGQSDTVENIFKKIGLDVRNETTFVHALDRLESDILSFAKQSKRS